MATGRPVWAPGNLTCSAAIKKGLGVKLHSTAGQVALTVAGNMPYAVATKDHASGDQFEGHLVQGSDIIEVLAGADIATPGSVVTCLAAGEFGTASTSGHYGVGFTDAAVADGDLFQLRVSITKN